MIEPGIYTDLSNDQYHADPAISRSRIMTFRESPYKYWAEYENPEHLKLKPLMGKTEPLIFGNAFHTMMLEPDLFYDLFAVKPEGIDKRTIKGKKEYEEYLIAKGNRTELSMDKIYLLHLMREAIEKHPEALALIQGAQYESSYFWRDANTGLMCKCRPDILHGNMIVDLKTIQSASSRYYQREMVERGYHIQAAMIREGVYQNTGVDIPNVVNICIEKVYPYEIGIKIISESALEAGKKAFFETLIDLNSRMRDNIFPSYQTEFVELPAWAL